MNRFGSVPFFVILILVVVARAVPSFETSMGLWVGNNPVPLEEDQFFISKFNESIRLWCKVTTPKTRWTECTWIWKELAVQEPPGYCKIFLANGLVDYNTCNTTLKFVEDRCEVEIPATVLENHEGNWSCKLDDPGIQDNFNTSKANLVVLRAIDQVVAEPNSVSLEVGQETLVQCSTTNGGFPNATFQWFLGEQALPPTPNETTECDDTAIPNLCKRTSSYLYQAPDTPMNTRLECRTNQIDSFNRIAIAQVFVPISVVEVGVLSASWTGGQIAGLVVGLLLLLLILIIFILAFCCGWCCFAGRKRRRVRQEEHPQRQRPQLVVSDSPTNYPKKEVTFVDKNPTAPPQTVIRRYSESDDESFYRPKIPAQNIWTTNNFVNTAPQRPHYPSHEYGMPPPPPPTYVVKDKWDPYDSESDVPFLFQFEGETAMLSPATSLSSLASSHLDDIDLNEHLRYLNWPENERDLSDDDDDTTSIDSEIFGRPFNNNNNNNRNSIEKTMEDESWV